MNTILSQPGKFNIHLLMKGLEAHVYLSTSLQSMGLVIQVRPTRYEVNRDAIKYYTPNPSTLRMTKGHPLAILILKQYNLHKDRSNLNFALTKLKKKYGRFNEKST